MHKTFNHLFLAVMTVAITVSGCKEDEDPTDITGPLSFTPSYIPQTVAGMIHVNVAHLSLHEGDQADVQAQLFYSDGTIHPDQPVFLLSSDNPNVASASGSTVTAHQVGTATIGVTDDVHGVKYITVEVLPLGTAIPPSAASISFDPPVLILQSGQSGSFTHTLYNGIGDAVAGAPTFFLSDPAGASVTGNTVSAGSQSGLYLLKAVIGSDTLAGSLQVIAGGSITSSNTFYINDVFYPASFGSPGLTAAPVRLYISEVVTDGSGNVISVIQYQTSPESITIMHPGILGESSGRLTSLAPGLARLTVDYFGASASGWSLVNFKLRDTFGEGLICLSFDNPDPDLIKYHSSGHYSFGSAPVTVTYTLACDMIERSAALQQGTHIIGYGSGPMTSAISPPGWNSGSGRFESGYYLGTAQITTCTPSGIQSSQFTMVDENTIKIEGPDQYVVNRGAGGCGPLQFTYTEFGSTTSTSGTCTLTYSSVALSFVSNGATGTMSINGTYSIAGTCIGAGDSGSFTCQINLTQDGSNVWSGTGTSIYGSEFTVSNGVLSASSFTSTITVQIPGWNDIVRQITLN